MAIEVIKNFDTIFFLYKYFYFASHKEDLSYKKNATQLPLYPGASYDASNAVDRNVGTCMRTEGIGLKSVYHSAWWKVDLFTHWCLPHFYQPYFTPVNSL